jgi:tetratricopeptide (TPR) repeat protein
LRKALDRAHDAGNIHQELAARLSLANVSYAAGDSDLAEKLASEALAEAQANQMEPLAVRGFVNLGSAQRGKGDNTGAEQTFQQALAIALRADSPRLVALSRLYLASVHEALHRTGDSIREASQALQYFQPNRFVQETFSCLLLLARGQRQNGDFSAALASAGVLLDTALKAQVPAQVAQAREILGQVYSAQEDYPKALEEFREFLKLSVDDARNTGYATLDCANTLARMGRYKDALPEFDRVKEAAAKLRELGDPLAISQAEMALSQNRWREAAAAVVKALANPKLAPLAAAAFNRIRGLALLRSGDRRAGATLCEEALATARKENDPGALLDARVAALEARITLADSTGAAEIFQELDASLSAHPERRWRALAWMARTDRQYAERAGNALNQLDTSWGPEVARQYRQRPDVGELVRHLVAPDSAKH